MARGCRISVEGDQPYNISYNSHLQARPLMLAIKADKDNTQGGASIHYEQKHAEKTVIPPTKLLWQKPPLRVKHQEPGNRRPRQSLTFQ
jgi:hypothetical protein